MSIKRGVLAVVSGIALEVVALYTANRFMGWGFERIKWSSIYVWLFFFSGFLTAVWLYVWSRLIARLFGGKKKATDSSPAVTPTQSQVVMSPVQTAAPQTPSNIPVSTPSPSESQEEIPQKEATSAGTPTAPTAPSMAPRPMAPRMAPPVRMAVQNNAILGVNPSDPTTAVQTPMVSSAAPVAQPKEPSKKESDIALLADIDPDLDMMAFKHVALEGKVIDLVYSSDDVAVLCKVFSDAHTWSVDMTQDIGDCTWTNENGETQKPCSILISQVAALKKMEADAEIIPTILMVRGSIQNFREVSDYLLQNKISLVQYENEELPGVTNLHELLKEKFSLFPGDDEEDEGTSDEGEVASSEQEEEGNANEETTKEEQQDA